jgi:hypothetical protein
VLQISEIDSHNSIGLGERMHSPLRRVYNKILMEYTHLHRTMLLKLAIKATNDTLGIGGIAPSMLVFGRIPRFPIVSSHIPEQTERMKALQIGMEEMNAAVAADRISEALRSQIPAAADRILHVDDKVMVYREKDQVWHSRFTVVNIYEKKVRVIDHLGEERHFSLNQVKPAPRRGYIEPQSGAASVDILNRHTPPSDSHSIHYMTMKVRSEEHLDKKVPIFATHITEVITKKDPRYHSPEVQAAMKKEIEGIVDKGTWAVTIRFDLSRGANVLSGRFVITIKDIGTERERYKARFVVQGHRDKDKTSMVHHSTTAKQHSTRLLIGLAAIFGCRICTHDV